METSTFHTYTDKPEQHRFACMRLWEGEVRFSDSCRRRTGERVVGHSSAQREDGLLQPEVAQQN